MGSYKAKKVPPAMKLNFEVLRTENDEVGKIYKQLKKKSSNSSNLNVDFGSRLLFADSTYVELRR